MFSQGSSVNCLPTAANVAQFTGLGYGNWVKLTPEELNELQQTEQPQSCEGEAEPSAKRVRKNFPESVVCALQRQFELKRYLTRTERKELAQRLNITERHVRVWFQNRRLRYKEPQDPEQPTVAPRSAPVKRTRASSRKQHQTTQSTIHETQLPIQDSNTQFNIMQTTNDNVSSNAPHQVLLATQNHQSNYNFTAPAERPKDIQPNEPDSATQKTDDSGAASQDIDDWEQEKLRIIETVWSVDTQNDEHINSSTFDWFLALQPTTTEPAPPAQKTDDLKAVSQDIDDWGHEKLRILETVWCVDTQNVEDVNSTTFDLFDAMQPTTNEHLSSDQKTDDSKAVGGDIYDWEQEKLRMLETEWLEDIQNAEHAEFTTFDPSAALQPTEPDSSTQKADDSTGVGQDVDKWEQEKLRILETELWI